MLFIFKIESDSRDGEREIERVKGGIEENEVEGEKIDQEANIY